MIFQEVTIKNFKQYYGSNQLNLVPQKEKNIILIGGKTGFGKTNFLTAIVWCLYGVKLDKVDERFRQATRRSSAYSSFLNESLNKTAKQKGIKEFSVSIQINDLEIPGNLSNNDIITCTITRSFDVEEALESLDIQFDGMSIDFKTDDDKVTFINDYIIPFEAAKFVFFDAEQISNMAAFQTDEEGGFMNDALSKILGLDIYQILLDDLVEYADNLKKDSADTRIMDQIRNCESTLKSIEVEKQRAEQQIDEKELEKSKEDSKILEYEKFLRSSDVEEVYDNGSQELYEQQKKVIAESESALKEFNELSELIPLLIASGMIQSTVKHLELQEKVKSNEVDKNELKEKISQLISNLFYQPEFPTSGDITYTQKSFYIQKAEKLSSQFINVQEVESKDLVFEHDLNNTDKELLTSVYQTLLNQSTHSFQNTIDFYEKSIKDLSIIKKRILKAEQGLVDESILRYHTDKKEAERKRDLYIESLGALKLKIQTLEKSSQEQNRLRATHLQKVQIAHRSKEKLDQVTSYMNVVEKFIKEQKESKCDSLANNIMLELKKIMHKLGTSNSKLIDKVKVDVLPNKGGLTVSLYDEIGNAVSKQILSQGEKQIYASCLIKAILKESIQNLPIFIDTPLGRLDQEHIKNILQNYYPDLSKQVVILAQDNEIPPSRYEMIKENVSKAYLLSHENQNTTFKSGYFQSI